MSIWQMVIEPRREEVKIVVFGETSMWESLLKCRGSYERSILIRTPFLLREYVGNEDDSTLST